MTAEDDEQAGTIIGTRRRNVVAAMREFADASEVLKKLFEHLGSNVADATARIERGTRALDVAQSIGVADRRATLNAAGVRLQKARHEFQLAMFLLAAEEGASFAEIARTWGVSRQLVSRIIRGQLDNEPFAPPEQT